MKYNIIKLCKFNEEKGKNTKLRDEQIIKPQRTETVNMNLKRVSEFIIFIVQAA